MNKNNNISLVMLVAVAILISTSFAKAHVATVIDRADKAEAACKELSQDSLIEIGLLPKNWRANATNDDNGFAIEGQWQTNSGRYRVECEVGFARTFDEVNVSISTD